MRLVASAFPKVGLGFIRCISFVNYIYMNRPPNILIGKFWVLLRELLCYIFELLAVYCRTSHHKEHWIWNEKSRTHRKHEIM